VGRQTQRHVARFRLHSHALRVKTRSWEHHDGTCDKCGLQQFKTKNMLFSCVLACKRVLWGFNLQTCFMIYLWHTKLLLIRLELFVSPKLVLRMSSIFSRDKLMIPILLSQSLWMLSVWLVFTRNLNSQTTWLKVKLKLVNLHFNLPGGSWSHIRHTPFLDTCFLIFHATLFAAWLASDFVPTLYELKLWPGPQYLPYLQLV